MKLQTLALMLYAVSSKGTSNITPFNEGVMLLKELLTDDLPGNRMSQPIEDLELSKNIQEKETLLDDITSLAQLRNLGFVNQSGGSVKIYWINNDSESHNKNLAAGQNLTVQTHAGHKWVVRDGKTDQVLHRAQGTSKNHNVNVYKFNGGQTILSFINKTNEKIKIYWVPSGGKKLIKTLEKGGTHNENTWPGHQWIVYGYSTKKVLLKATAMEEPQTFQIGNGSDQNTSPNAERNQNDHRYFHTKIQGFNIWYTKAVNQKFPNFKSQMEKRLKEINRAVPSNVLNVMKKTPGIYINDEYYYNGVRANDLVVHWSKGWLIPNGNIAAKEGAVEIYNYQVFERDYFNPTATLLHELSHVYHWKRQGQIDRLIEKTYNKVEATKKYHKVKNNRGQTVKAYASTDHKEYFAEISVAFYGVKDHEYPWSNSDLKKFDPDGYNMLVQVYGVHGPRVLFEDFEDLNELKTLLII